MRVFRQSLFELNKNSLFWSLQIAGWAALSLFTLVVAWVTDPSLLPFLGFRQVFGFLITAFLVRPLLHFAREKCRDHRVGLVIGSILLALLLGAIDSQSTQEFGKLLRIDTSSEKVKFFLSASFAIRSFQYMGWIILYFSVNYWLETRAAHLHMGRLEAENQAAELDFLRAQVNPHFLFNALNSILAVADQPRTVTALTQGLADYLRFSLRQGGDFQPLGDELDALESYLQVEKIRFKDRLHYTLVADEDARRSEAPRALVQPLLENAIKFGQRTSPRPLRIAIVAQRHDGTLRVTVENTGHWGTEQPVASTGIGLGNLRRRLELLFGSLAKVMVETPAGRVIVRVEFPTSPPLPSST